MYKTRLLWLWLYGIIGSWTDIYNKSLSPPVNLIPGQVYLIQFYEIKFISGLWKIDGFLQQLKTSQGCGIAMPDSYIEPAGQVDSPG